MSRIYHGKVLNFQGMGEKNHDHERLRPKWNTQERRDLSRWRVSPIFSLWTKDFWWVESPILYHDIFVHLRKNGCKLQGPGKPLREKVRTQVREGEEKKCLGWLQEVFAVMWLEKRGNVTVGTLRSTLSRLGDSGLEIAEVTYNLPLEGP